MNKTTKLFGGFSRLQNFPLDTSTVYQTYAEAEEYVSSKIAYAGQLIAVINDGDKNGIYVIKDGGLEGLYISGCKLAESEVVAAELKTLKDSVNGDLDSFREILTEYNTRVEAAEKAASDANNAVESMKGTYATKEELADEVNKILGDRYEELDTAMNSVSEIADWITAHRDLLGELEEIAQKLDVYTKAEIDAKIDAIDVSEQLKDYVKKEELEDLSGVSKTYSFQFGTSHINEMILPKGKNIDSIKLYIESAAREDLLNSIKLIINDIEIVKLEDVDFSECDDNEIEFNFINYPIESESKICITCDDFKGCQGKVFVNLFQIV